MTCFGQVIPNCSVCYAIIQSCLQSRLNWALCTDSLHVPATTLLSACDWGLVLFGIYVQALVGSAAQWFQFPTDWFIISYIFRKHWINCSTGWIRVDKNHDFFEKLNKLNKSFFCILIGFSDLNRIFSYPLFSAMKSWNYCVDLK